MGLKLRLGLALSGLAPSSMFGFNMLSGIKDYVDTTGNIMVDIADGIGMVSQVTQSSWTLGRLGVLARVLCP